MICGVCSENAISIATDLSLWRSRYRVSLIKMKSEGQGFDPPRRHFFAIGTVFFHLVFAFDNGWNNDCPPLVMVVGKYREKADKF